jgi:hypothetical protein
MYVDSYSLVTMYVLERMKATGENGKNTEISMACTCHAV